MESSITATFPPAELILSMMSEFNFASLLYICFEITVVLCISLYTISNLLFPVNY